MPVSKSTLGMGACALVATLAAVFLSRQEGRLRTENEALRSQIAARQNSPPEPRDSNGVSPEELIRLTRDAADVLRLRGEVYAFADGHSELRREPVEGFDLWEQRRIFKGP